MGQFRADRSRPFASSAGGSGSRPPQGGRLYLRHPREFGGHRRTDEGLLRSDLLSGAGSDQRASLRVLICAGSDGRNAARQVERIATGWRLKAVADPLIVCTHAQTPETILAPKIIGRDDLKR